LCAVGASLAGLSFLIERKPSQKQVVGDDLRALPKHDPYQSRTSAKHVRKRALKQISGGTTKPVSVTSVSNRLAQGAFGSTE
jgi:hypothetical protein